MGLALPRLVAATACVAALALLSALSGEAIAAKQPTAKSSLKALVKQTNRLPDAAASAAKRRALKRLAVHARRSARLRPCTSVRDLSKFRRVIAGVRVKKNLKGRRRRAAQRLSALAPASVEASRLLLATRRTRRCGGGVPPPRGDHPKLKLLRSDARRLRVRVQLPAVQFVPREGGGKLWTQLVLPNSDAPGAPGTPGIPVVSDVLAVPDGAKIRVKTNDVDKIVVDGVNVFPVQRDPVDQEPNTEQPNFLAGPFADRPFALNQKAYAKDALVPTKPADADSLGTVRDLNIGALQIPTAQYNPDSKKLTLLKSVDVTLSFVGGEHRFSTELANPWEINQRRLFGSLLNANLLRNIRILEIIRRCGEEMMVITNAGTQAAAHTFAAARNAAGIRTRVFEVGAGAGQIGTTPAQIQTVIRSHLNNFLCVRPSYVTIMGDDDLVPVFPGINGIPSDLQYSMRNDADELPDIAVGRILGNDQAAVGTAVNKIISYENTPPPGLWTRRATIAAQFQDDNADGKENRTFIQFAETVRNGLVGNSITVDRIYGEHPASNPQQFNDGTDLPAELKKPTFAWDGDGADVTAAWNDGRFLMIHRDHGWSDGWGTPAFNTTNVQALTNGNILPVVMSINCSSGAFDYDETSFASESLVKANGGSVGVFGDTRDSPTWHNTQIALGFVDGMIPNVLPSEGPVTRQRVGNALITGKLRLAGLAPPNTDGSTRNELYLWHYFGDPTMQMWGGQPPLKLDPSRFTAVFKEEIGPPPPDPPPFWVQVTLPAEFNGQPFSLLRRGDVIGKGVAQNGLVNIPASFGDSSAPSGQLQVALDADGAEPLLIEVQDEEPRRATSLTQNCPQGNVPNDEPAVVSGTLSGAPPGSVVRVTYERPTAGDITLEDATDADGQYETSLTTAGSNDTWHATARFAGTDQYAPSQGVRCEFSVD